MTQIPSAEAIVNLCRQRGLTGFDLPKLKTSLAARGQDGQFVAKLQDSYIAVARGVDDSCALRWFSDMKQALHDEPVPQSPRPSKRVSGGPSYKAFGTAAALTFELDELRSQDRMGSPIKTVTVEAANATGVRTYNWDEKVIVQLTQNELPLFVGAMLGMRSRWEASGHGQEHNKAIKLERQPKGVHVQVAYGSRVMSVRVEHGIAFHVAALAMMALQAQYPHLTSDAILTMCGRVCEGA